VICGEEKKKKNLRFTRMILRIQHIVLCVLIVVAVSACSKSGTAADNGGNPHVEIPNDTIPPQITIFTPTNNQVFSTGNVITISGKVTDDYGLYRGSIRIVNDANGAALLNQSYEIHGILLYNFNLNQTASAGVATDYTVTVTFEDHGNNTATQSVKVKVNP
jgi:hypothetical protein